MCLITISKKKSKIPNFIIRINNYFSYYLTRKLYFHIFYFFFWRIVLYDAVQSEEYLFIN